MKISEKILSEELFFLSNLDRNEYTREHMLKAMKSIAWDAWSRGLNEENIEKEREFFEIWFDMDLNEQKF